jgi:chromosome segregation ATPase
VVETIMIFALGFLAATLIALLIVPAVNARADRLARRRAEALLPLSVSELTAEKDLLRAEFAVLQTRIERKAAKAMAVKHDSMEELGRRAIRIDTLEADLSDRDGTIAALRSELSDLQAKLAATEEELAVVNAALSGTRETLAAIEDAHRKTLDELANSRSECELVKAELSSSKAELASAQEKQQAAEFALIESETRHNQALSELDTKRIMVSDLETRLATQTDRGRDFERALSEYRTELSEERQRLADLARDLLAEQERGLLLDQQMREWEKERNSRAADAETLTGTGEDGAGRSDPTGATPDPKAASATPAERGPVAERRSDTPLNVDERSDQDAAQRIDGLNRQVEILKAEKASLEGALSVAREARVRLDQELAATRRRGEAGSEAMKAENAELRKHILDVADEIMKAASRQKAKDPSVTH